MLMVNSRNVFQNSGVASVANPSDSPNKLTRPRVHTKPPSIAIMKKNQHIKNTPKAEIRTIVAFPQQVSNL